MISLTHAKKEISRLRLKIGYPTHMDELSALVTALRLGSKNNEHATLVVSEALDISEFCPEPDSLAKLCEDVSKRASEFPPPCDDCLQWGGNWRQEKFDASRYGSGLYKGQTATAMTRCHCARGRLLAARDEQERVAQAIRRNE